MAESVAEFRGYYGSSLIKVISGTPNDLCQTFVWLSEVCDMCISTLGMELSFVAAMSMYHLNQS